MRPYNLLVVDLNQLENQNLNQNHHPVNNQYLKVIHHLHHPLLHKHCYPLLLYILVLQHRQYHAIQTEMHQDLLVRLMIQTVRGLDLSLIHI